MIIGTSGTVFKTLELPASIARVQYLGYVDDETLAGLYAQARVFILPSQDEGFGLPALEAMASGTPVIVSDGGALPEVVGEAGWVVRLSNPTELENALLAILNDATLQCKLREKGLQRASEFSWQTTAELVWKELHEL
jgi:alpha-1,3-rhamnosyl/mannosyltransferase